MGKETKSEKQSLSEFLYRDSEMLSSLYSQVFGGDLTGVSTHDTSTDETAVDGGINAVVANGKMSYKGIASEQLVKNILAKDEKIIELFDELDIKEYKNSLNNYSNGRIIKMNGDLYFRNLDTFKKTIPFMDKFGLMPKDLFGEDSEYGQEHVDSFIDLMVKILPYGLEFEVITNKYENVICSIEDKYLTSDFNHISKNYTSKYLGNWNIIGIFDNIKPKKDTFKYSSENEIKKGIDEIEDAMLSFLYPKDSNNFVIKPIIIYRILSY